MKQERRDIQSRLNKLSAYNVTLNVFKGSYIVSLHFNSKWSVIKPQSDDIAFTVDKKDKTLFYYVTPISNDINIIFDSIDETIQYNEELQLKMSLFSDKIKELQEVFTTTSYEDLKRLVFIIEKPSVGKKKPAKDNKSKGKDVVEPTKPTETKESDENKEQEPLEGESELDRKLNEFNKKNK